MSRKEREAEESLREWAIVTRSRDERVRAAVAAGVSKYRVNQLTRIGRSTIDRILAATPEAPARKAIFPAVSQDGESGR